MTQFVIANNVNTQLAAAATSSATTLTLASSTNLPTLNTSIGQIMPLTLNDAATGNFYEVVYVTAISGVTLTVLRAQEGTGALNWNVGDYAYCAPTAGTVGLTTMRTQYQAANSFSSSQTLTASIAGESVGFTGSSASAFLLPAQSSVPTLTPTAVYNDGAAALTMTANGTDKFVVASGQVTSIVMQPGDDLSFYASATAGLWTASSGSALRQYEPLVVGAGTAANDAAQIGQIQTQAGTAFAATGTAPAYVLTPTPAITAYAANQRFRVKFTAGGTTGSNTLNISGQGSVALMQYGPDGTLIPAVIPAGLLTDVEYNGTYMVVLDPVVSGLTPIQPISASVASNALTLGLGETALNFRSGTLATGSATPLSIGTALSLVVPSGATLGTIATVQAQLALLVAYNGGAPVLCVANMSGGINLDETTLISPTTISAGASSASTIYSASAVSANSPFRVVGYITITEATAGTWATAPTLVQGYGGQAMAAMQSLGVGQTGQILTGSRAYGTTYYNTTGRTILVNAYATMNTSAAALYGYINGVQTFVGSQVPASDGDSSISFLVPPGFSYSVQASTGTATAVAWSELR